MSDNPIDNVNNDEFYNLNEDPLLNLANDIIEESIFYREGTPKPPLPSSIANDVDILTMNIPSKITIDNK